MSVSSFPRSKHGLIHREPSYKKSGSFVFDNKEEARMALDLILSLIKREGVVTVYDIYSYLGIGVTTEDDLIGWSNVDGIFIKESRKWNRKSYYLILPRLNWSR